jgi:hypothetical protein
MLTLASREEGHPAMPIFAVNLSERLFGSIRNLVDKGLYQSLEGFIEVAAYNQLALERGVTPHQLLDQGHRQPQHAQAPAPPAEEARPAQSDARPESKQRKPKKGHRKKKGGKARARKEQPAPAAPGVDVEAVLGRWAAPSGGAFPAPATAEGLPSGEHIWGQVNRLFALKLACRWVARAATGRQWPNYLAVADGLADDAAMIGAVLEQWDAAAGRKRDEVLATGLPRRGNSASRDRFLSQYLARVTRGGKVQPGAVCRYALAACGEDAIALTEQGLKFALMPNPILDQRQSDSPVTLGDEEAAFLCRQVRERAPGEHADMKTVLTAVSSGEITPSAVAAAVRGSFPADWSEVVFRTHLSGLVARLTDLRLLRRRWEGRNVQYCLGDAGTVEAFVK